MLKYIYTSLLTIIGLETLRYIYRKKIKEKEINEALFFQGDTCTSSACNLRYCSYHNLRKIIEYLENTQFSLDICLYLLSSKELIHVINRLNDRGVEIRLITDSGSNGINHNMLKCFYDRGIIIKTGGTKSLMHHKFAIIDNKLLLFGSLNWTRLGIYNNWDNICITSSKQMLNKFRVLFNSLWSEFKDNLVITEEAEDAADQERKEKSKYS